MAGDNDIEVFIDGTIESLDTDGNFVVIKIITHMDGKLLRLGDCSIRQDIND